MIHNTTQFATLFDQIFTNVYFHIFFKSLIPSATQFKHNSFSRNPSFPHTSCEWRCILRIVLVHGFLVPLVFDWRAGDHGTKASGYQEKKFKEGNPNTNPYGVDYIETRRVYILLCILVNIENRG